MSNAKNLKSSVIKGGYNKLNIPFFSMKKTFDKSD